MTYKEHIKQNLNLGIPVMISQIGVIAVNFVDTIMVGNIEHKDPNYSSIALGGVSLGNAIFFAIFIFAMGISMSISPMVSHANAQGKVERVKRLFSHGMLLSVLIGLVLSLIALSLLPFLSTIIIDPKVAEVTKSYLFINILSLVPMMIFQAYKQLSEGMHFTKGVTYATILGNIINIFLNYLLINGNWGFPKYGVDGSAYATLVARVLMIFLLVYFLKNNSTTVHLIQLQFSKFSKLLLSKMLSLGFPIAFQLLFEVSAFSLAAFICEKSSTKELAAHQITLQVASMTFLICTGLSVSSTIQVGKFKGLNDAINLKKAADSNLFLIVIFMIFCGISFVIFRNEIPTIFTKDLKVIEISASLFIIASLFQLFDGVQVVTLGALRGVQDVKIPTFITFCSYWILAIPLGWFLTIHQKMGAFGMWIALGLGLSVSAILLTYRFNKVAKIQFQDKASII